MKKQLLISIWALIVALIWTTSALAQTVEINTDRQGNDFDRVTLHLDDHNLCQKICSDTDQCQAWTYTPPGFNLYETPQCWLKDGVSRGFARTGAVSGTFPERARPDDKDEELLSSQAAEAAFNECRDMHDDSTSQSLCVSFEATAERDITLCDALQEQDRNLCRDSSSRSIQHECGTLADPEDEFVCRRVALLAFPDNSVCRDPTLVDFKMECYLTIAHHTGDHEAIMGQIRNLDTDERDLWVASLAALELDYGLLELIEDNRTYDQTLTAISINRIGAGRYVEPGVCAAAVGGYSDTDGGLSAADLSELCIETIAKARVLDEWAEYKTIEEILELQAQMEEYVMLEEIDAGTFEFPMGLESKFRAAIAEARAELQAARVTQSGYQDPSPSPEPSQPVEPSAPVILQPAGDYGADCPFGLC